MSASTTSAVFDESVVVIGPPGEELVGVLARPVDRAATKPIGVVIVVGGPQTRVGSHRQFVLLARALAQAGYPCLRFDYAGMGDSPGPRPDFERAGPDIRRACDALVAQVPGCAKIALWGLCDGATAALFYASDDQRIAAVFAANPWARSEATRSAALVSDHYGARLRSGEFWRKLLTGKVDVAGAVREALGHLARARAQRRRRDDGPAVHDLPTRLARVLATSRLPIRLQISGRDLTAAEFEIAMKAAGVDGAHTKAMRLEDADHTFSNPERWRAVIGDTLEVLPGLADRAGHEGRARIEGR